MKDFCLPIFCLQQKVGKFITQIEPAIEVLRQKQSPVAKLQSLCVSWPLLLLELSVYLAKNLQKMHMQHCIHQPNIFTLSFFDNFGEPSFAFMY